jgi:hypothetical protein
LLRLPETKTKIHMWFIPRVIAQRSLATRALLMRLRSFFSEEFLDPKLCAVQIGGTIGYPGVTPGLKGQSRVHLIHASEKTTYIITECIEINVTI